MKEKKTINTVKEKKYQLKKKEKNHQQDGDFDMLTSCHKKEIC